MRRHYMERRCCSRVMLVTNTSNSNSNSLLWATVCYKIYTIFSFIDFDLISLLLL